MKHKFVYMAGVLFLMLAIMPVLSAVPAEAQNNGSEDDVENPQTGSLGLEGVVEGEPPDRPAGINTPVDGQVITETPVTVAGTCQSGLIVEIYKNDVLAGSTMCEENNTFELDISLFFGENVLIARVRDLLGQAGPDSEPVTVTYDPPVAESDRQLGQQLIITSNTSFRGAMPGSEISFPMRIAGGEGPYAVSVNWGDGGDDVFTRSDTGSFDISHVYERPGIYRVVVQVSDDQDQSAFWQFVAIISGDIDNVFDVDEAAPEEEVRYILWPLYVLLAMIPLAYWLGIRHQRRKYE